MPHLHTTNFPEVYHLTSHGRIDSWISANLCVLDYVEMLMEALTDLVKCRPDDCD
jgi:hypothetical protein